MTKETKPVDETNLAVETLSGKLLIAMPGMGDTRFEHSVVYLCAHSEDGAMGLIVNKPSRELNFDMLLEQLEIPRSPDGQDIRIHFGGPVENARGFVLHSNDYGAGESTLEIDQSFGMTATLSILEDLARGEGPENSLLALGYAGWGPGQLEDEIMANGWLTCEASPDLIFSKPNDHKWEAALETLGVSSLMLSATAGNA